jgi:8-oxo-dGTP pyrophosphatase MutT (NUDIX family)
MAKVKRYAAAGGVVIDTGKMLLLDRPSRQEVRLPKGHIEEGETPVVAALRESCEETGYADLEVLRDLGEQVVEFDYQGDHIIRTEHYFLMRKRSARQARRTPKDAKQFQVRWVDLPLALEMLTYEAEKNVARKAIAALTNLEK